ncbi:uncharacterized protein C8R40DRAFT_1178258 [Lentinula edodes]|uniref:uncharacterized protein n=1 Tax=Lentinula edodes TaxID=5353 RepID=UPI001E8C9DB0|nr:uncharacterized protein C8R40DRAFT_1178258 [Lentinula edodes]KAH7868046.1 hypothetical protein C8R40DRAFT_1178258 [Lentinula edodes]
MHEETIMEHCMYEDESSPPKESCYTDSVTWVIKDASRSVFDSPEQAGLISHSPTRITKTIGAGHFARLSIHPINLYRLPYLTTLVYSRSIVAAIIAASALSALVAPVPEGQGGKP